MAKRRRKQKRWVFPVAVILISILVYGWVNTGLGMGLAAAGLIIWFIWLWATSQR